MLWLDELKVILNTLDADVRSASDGCMLTRLACGKTLSALKDGVNSVFANRFFVLQPPHWFSRMMQHFLLCTRMMNKFPFWGELFL